MAGRWGLGRRTGLAAERPPRRLAGAGIVVVGALLASGAYTGPAGAESGSPVPCKSGGACSAGWNAIGQLGNGTLTDIWTMGPVATSAHFVTIAASQGHSLAIDNYGRAWGWGENNMGQIGDGTTVSSSVPRPAQMPVGVTFTQIGGGDKFTAALDTTGKAWADGVDYYGQSGDGRVIGHNQNLVPTKMPLGVTFTKISVGRTFVLALDTTGKAWGWGDNSSGQLGSTATYGSYSDVPTPVAMPAGVTFTSVAAGTTTNGGALDTTGHAWVWGLNSNGIFGNGTTGTSSVTPVPVSMPAGVTFTSLSLATASAVALDTTGGAWAWGLNHNGQVGNGTTTDALLPAAVIMPLGVHFTSATTSLYASVAIDTTGGGWTWGSDEFGQGGNATKTFALTKPTAVQAVGITFTAITTGGGDTIALTAGV